MVKIIDSNYEFIDDAEGILTKEDVLKKIELCGRVSYKSEDKITDESSEAFVKARLNDTHVSILGHTNIIFKLRSTTIAKIRQYNCGFLRFRGLKVSGSIRSWRDFFLENYGSFDEDDEDRDFIHIMWKLYRNYGFLFKKVEQPSLNFYVDRFITQSELTHQDLFIHGVQTVRFITSRGTCYDDQTEVLTEDGWKLFDEINKNDKFITLNMQTKETEYQKHTNTIIQEWDNDLIYGKSTMVDFAVTPNHRMLWYHYDSRIDKKWKIDTANEIFDRRVKFQRGLFKNYKGDYNIQKQDLNEYADGTELSLDFARFMGIFITDGSKYKNKSGSTVYIHQIKQNGRKYIKNLLINLGYHFNETNKLFKIKNARLYKFLTYYFPEHEKRYETARVPKFIRFANKEYIEAFLEGVIMGDGNIYNNHKSIYTTNYKLVGDYQECVLKSGKCSSIKIDNRVGEKRYNDKIGSVITNKRICYVLSITDRTNEHLFNKHHWSKKHYKGKVYCVTVPNGTLYVRRNGKSFWSGNSHQLVRHGPANFTQESTLINYTKRGDQITCIKPQYYDSISLEEIQFASLNINVPSTMHMFESKYGELGSDCINWLEGLSNNENTYFKRVSSGTPPKRARGNLPIDLKTEVIMTTNLSHWYHIFKLRTHPSAHPDVRKLMIPLLKEFKIKYPGLFDDLKDYDDLK